MKVRRCVCGLSLLLVLLAPGIARGEGFTTYSLGQPVAALNRTSAPQPAVSATAEADWQVQFSDSSPPSQYPPARRQSPIQAPLPPGWERQLHITQSPDYLWVDGETPLVLLIEGVPEGVTPGVAVGAAARVDLRHLTAGTWRLQLVPRSRKARVLLLCRQWLQEVPLLLGPREVAQLDRMME